MNATQHNHAEDSSTEHHAILHGMLRSFTTLARTLNLSHAMKELGSTRQTLRRHIDLLEAVKGEPLFRIEDRQYHLTEAGVRALPDALDILARGNAWLSGGLRDSRGLQWVHKLMPNGHGYWQQQKPLGDLWLSERKMARHVAQAWGRAEGALECSAFAIARPYGMVFRKHEDHWLCVEVGEKSAFASWFGWAEGRSSIGKTLEQMPLSDGFASVLMVPYTEIYRGQHLRLDHVATFQAQTPGGADFPVTYQRLLVGVRLADETPAVAAFVDRCHEIQIDGLAPAAPNRMDERFVTPNDDILG
jgi:hypothetical protein